MQYNCTKDKIQISNLRNNLWQRRSLEKIAEKKEDKQMGFYDYVVTTPDGSEVSMKDFEGKVVLVVNTATGCGFTPHYKDLEEMYEKFYEKGFEIVDVPCNQFAG